MLRIGRSPYFQAPVTMLLALAFFFAAGSGAYASGPVKFTVRRSPLKVKLLVPAKPVRGRPAVIRAIVRNAGNRRLKAGTVELGVRPQSSYSRAIKIMKVLPAGSRRTFTWRVRFPKARTYILSASAKARRKGPAMHVAGAKKRIKVRKRANALSLFASLAKTLASL